MTDWRRLANQVEDGLGAGGLTRGDLEHIARIADATAWTLMRPRPEPLEPEPVPEPTNPPDPGERCRTCGVERPSGVCSECGGPLPPGTRADRLTCSAACRTRRSRRLSAVA